MHSGRRAPRSDSIEPVHQARLQISHADGVELVFSVLGVLVPADSLVHLVLVVEVEPGHGGRDQVRVQGVARRTPSVVRAAAAAAATAAVVHDIAVRGVAATATAAALAGAQDEAGTIAGGAEGDVAVASRQPLTMDLEDAVVGRIDVALKNRYICTYYRRLLSTLLRS